MLLARMPPFQKCWFITNTSSLARLKRPAVRQPCRNANQITHHHNGMDSGMNWVSCGTAWNAAYCLKKRYLKNNKQITSYVQYKTKCNTVCGPVSWKAGWVSQRQTSGWCINSAVLWIIDEMLLRWMLLPFTSTLSPKEASNHCPIYIPHHTVCVPCSFLTHGLTKGSRGNPNTSRPFSLSWRIYHFS